VDISERLQRELLIERLSEENRRLAQAALRAREAERQRIATDLHDELAQGLTLIRTELARLEERADSGGQSARRLVREIDGLVVHVIALTRAMLRNLQPVEEHEAGLREALEQLVGQWQMQHRVACRLDLSALPQGLGQMERNAIYRIIQECLTNVARHARARRVLVRCRQVEREGASWVEVVVEDDGIGLREEKPVEGLGMVGMRTRTADLGGMFTLGKGEMGGCRITALFPAGGANQGESENGE